jgi:hypothetical protein
VWRRRTLLALGLGLLGLVLLTGLLGASSAQSDRAQPITCPEHWASGGHLRLAGCNVPVGVTVDPCSTVTFGKISCPISTPDLNPLDWLSFDLCNFEAVIGTIWNQLESYVASFLISIVQGLVNAILAPLSGIETAVSSAVVGVIDSVGSFVTSFFNSVTAAAAPLGPFAPVLVVSLTLLVILAGSIGLYFVVIFLFAFGKTLFNLA